MPQELASEILDRAMAVNPKEPGQYLLGLAIGWMQAQGYSLDEIQALVKQTYETTWDEAAAAARRLDQRRSKG
jgi:hypothetical protein